MIRFLIRGKDTIFGYYFHKSELIDIPGFAENFSEFDYYLDFTRDYLNYPVINYIQFENNENANLFRLLFQDKFLIEQI